MLKKGDPVFDIFDKKISWHNWPLVCHFT